MSYYFDRLCENCEYRLENGECVVTEDGICINAGECVVTEDGVCINAKECESFLQKE